MAVRLQLKLGAVTDQDRLPDSPDTVVVVEPSVGSVARSKGNLYLLVTSRNPGSRAREATRLVAETVRNEYYYDESAGIRQCLVKVLGIANKRLAHQRDRFALGHQADGTGPIGVAVAVVRGHEMYVATVGPAEAYLIRQARLSTLPDPNGERGLPANELVPEVWRGELAVGDSLCLVSANLMSRVGTDALKDALVTLHPQSAVEHVHARFVAADGKGSDGAVAFEATEVGATFKARTLVPVRPAEPLAGAPDHSPIPLADSVTAGAAAIGAGATRARDATTSRFGRLVWRIQDRLPKRGGGSKKVTTASSRMETQRRAAVALLAFVVVAATLTVGILALGGQHQPGQEINSISAQQAAFEAAQAAIARLNTPGVDLIADDPSQALQLLRTAYDQLAKAEAAGYPKAEIAPLRVTVMAGLDRIYGVVNVASTDVFTFPAKAGAVHLAGLVKDRFGVPYVLDTGTKTVWRIDPVKKTATPILKSGQKTNFGRVADPKILTTGFPDVLVLDAKNVLWRWRPLDSSGKGTLVKINVTGSTTWGTDVKVLATFVSNFSAAFYLLYVVDPSEQNIMKFAPNSDGSGYSSAASRRLATDRPVDQVTALLIDGDIFATDGGTLERLSPATNWKPATLPDVDLRPTSTYTLIDSPNNPDGSYTVKTGTLYVFDTTNHRVVAFKKSDGSYVGQYQLANGATGWADLRDLLILPGATADIPPTLWWISSTGLHSSPLKAVPSGAAAPPSPSPSSSATPKPGKTPKPGRTPAPSRSPGP